MLGPIVDFGNQAIFQLISLAILIISLYLLLYKPTMNYINSREEEIKNGIDNAKKAKEERENLKKEYKKTLDEAKKEASKIIERTLSEAQKLKENAAVEAKEEARKIIEDAKIAIQREKESAIRDVRKEVANLSINMAEVILNEEFSKDKEEKFIRRIADKLIGKS
jgi:F-type H+-transporting ATPase subunit b